MGVGMGENFEGDRLQRIAGQHRRRLVIGAVHSGPAPAQIIIIHTGQIVMDQRIGVNALERRGDAQ